MTEAEKREIIEALKQIASIKKRLEGLIKYCE
jgi:hypothetical protein